MDLFKLDDYKEALKLIIRNRATGSRGAFKNIAEYLGVNPTYVSQVLSGSRHFSEEQIFSACEYLGTSQLEAQYLLILVQIERAGTFKLKDHFIKLRGQMRQQASKVSSRVPKTRELSETENATFYSHYLFSAIQIASSLDERVTFDFICKRFNLAPGRARKILDFLVDTQLILEMEGQFKPGTSFTHIDKSSPFALKHLSNWRLKAIDAAAEMSDEEMFYSVNFSVGKKDFEVLREKLVILIQDFLNIVKNSPSEDIAQFNLDLFWVKK